LYLVVLSCVFAGVGIKKITTQLQKIQRSIFININSK